MLFLILSVTLISVLGFALLRHWKTRKYKKNFTSPYRNHNRRL